ncbi:MAG: glycine oxidase ThiO [Pirellulaceae bacterium]
MAEQIPDCLIVGGGVIGLSLALELSRHGASVTLVEKGAIGKEASWAGAGLLPPANPDHSFEPQERLRGLSHQLFPQWSAWLREQTGIDNEFEVCGGVYVARDIGEAASLASAMFQYEEEGVRVEKLTQVELLTMLPGLSAEIPYRSAYSLPDEAVVRNPRHLKALKTACQMQGVRLVPETEVQCFTLGQQRITGVETNQGTFTGSQVALCAGSWTQLLSDLLFEQLGLANEIQRPEIEPIRGQMLLFHTGETILLSCPVNEGPRYLVPRRDGHLLVGSTVEEAGFDKSNTPEAIEDLQQFAFSLLPALREAQLIQAWSGLRPASLDRIPYIGRIPGIENAFLAAGHYRSGLHLSPATAQLLAQLMRGETPQIDLAPFRLDRG